MLFNSIGEDLRQISKDHAQALMENKEWKAKKIEEQQRLLSKHHLEMKLLAIRRAFRNCSSSVGLAELQALYNEIDYFELYEWYGEIDYILSKDSEHEKIQPW